MSGLSPAPGSGAPLTQDQYWKKHVTLFVRMCVLTGGIVCFFMGITTLATIGVLGLIDGVFIIGLGYGICFRRSRACAVVAGVYYALNYLMLRMLPIGAAADTSILMYVFIALLIASIYGTFAFQSSYAKYLSKALAGTRALDPPDEPGRN